MTYYYKEKYIWNVALRKTIVPLGLSLFSVYLVNLTMKNLLISIVLACILFMIVYRLVFLDRRNKMRHTSFEHTNGTMIKRVYDKETSVLIEGSKVYTLYNKKHVLIGVSIQNKRTLFIEGTNLEALYRDISLYEVTETKRTVSEFNKTFSYQILLTMGIVGMFVLFVL